MMHGDTWGADHLGTALRRGADVLLLDCRDPNQYNTSHIKGALHVTIPSIILRRMKKTGTLNTPLASIISCPEDKERFSKCVAGCDMVVVYEHAAAATMTSQGGAAVAGDTTRSVSSVLIAKLIEDGCRACFLREGFENFQLQHPDLCTSSSDVTQLGSTPTSILGLSNLTINHDSSSAAHGLDPSLPGGGGVGHLPKEADQHQQQQAASVFPVEVLPHLFLGNCENSADLKCLYKHGIKHVVNVTQDCANHFEQQADGGIRYLRIPIKDHWSENLSDFFYQAILFIDTARQREEGVLIHCLAGISRSVTVTLAYLMHSLNLDLNEAFECVKRKRANISPNFNFMGQLQDFEKTLKSEKNCTCNCPKRNSFFSAGVSPPSTAGASPPSTAGAGVDSPSTTDDSVSDAGSTKDMASNNITTSKTGLAACQCSCHSLKSYFMSPGSTNNSSGSSSISVTSSGNTSSPQFNYEVPPSPS